MSLSGNHPHHLLNRSRPKRGASSPTAVGVAPRATNHWPHPPSASASGGPTRRPDPSHPPRPARRRSAPRLSVALASGPKAGATTSAPCTASTHTTSARPRRTSRARRRRVSAPSAVVLVTADRWIGMAGRPRRSSRLNHGCLLIARYRTSSVRHRSALPPLCHRLPTAFLRTSSPRRSQRRYQSR